MSAFGHAVLFFARQLSAFCCLSAIQLLSLELSEHRHKSYLKAKTRAGTCARLESWSQPLCTIEVIEQMRLFGELPMRH